MKRPAEVKLRVMKRNTVHENKKEIEKKKLHFLRL